MTKAGDDFKGPATLVRKLGDPVAAGIALHLNRSHDTVPDGIHNRVAGLIGMLGMGRAAILN